MLTIKKDGVIKQVSKPAYSSKYQKLGYEIVLNHSAYDNIVEKKEIEKERDLGLEDFTVDELRSLAKEEEIQGYYAMVKADLIEALEKVM